VKNRLPEVAAVLAAGATDWRTVQLIITRTEFVSNLVIARVDASLARRISKWRCWSHKRVINAVDATVRARDHEAIRERSAARTAPFRCHSARRQDDEKQRHRCDGGRSDLDKALTELASAVCRDDPRTMGQRRADAAKAMAEGRRLECECGADDCPNRSEAIVPRTRLVIDVIASEETVFGDGRQPGYLQGFGGIDAEQARAIAEDATLRMRDEPTVSAAAALHCQPSAELERWVRMRDITCSSPHVTGLQLPATSSPQADLNQQKRYLTLACNLKYMCREHHLLRILQGRGPSVRHSSNSLEQVSTSD
jgi:uncharacterized protein DUF222